VTKAISTHPDEESSSISHANLSDARITRQARAIRFAKSEHVVPAGRRTSSSTRAVLRSPARSTVSRRCGTRCEACRVFRLGDIATLTHGFASARALWCVRKASPARNRRGHGQGANISSSARNPLPLPPRFMSGAAGPQRQLIAEQPKVVEHAVGEFVHSFIEALAIVLFVRFVALAGAPHRGGAVGAAGAGIVFTPTRFRSVCIASRWAH